MYWLRLTPSALLRLLAAWTGMRRLSVPLSCSTRNWAMASSSSSVGVSLRLPLLLQKLFNIVVAFLLFFVRRHRAIFDLMMLRTLATGSMEKMIQYPKLVSEGSFLSIKLNDVTFAFFDFFNYASNFTLMFFGALPKYFLTCLL